jgi:signal transduction histidine kinase
MTFTQKLRLSLFAVALLPPLFIMGVIYFHAADQAEAIDQRNAANEIRKFRTYRSTEIADLRGAILQVSKDPLFQRAYAQIDSPRRVSVDLSPLLTELDFLELIDRDRSVRMSASRPALVGDTLPPFPLDPPGDSAGLETVEYDLNGPHASFALVVPVDSVRSLYAGRYLEHQFLPAVSTVLDADLVILFPTDSSAELALYSRMEPGQLYHDHDQYRAMLAGSRQAGFLLAAAVRTDSQRPVFRSLLAVAGAVAVGSVALALAIGFYMSYRTKREIDNLIIATTRVAAGDLNTPVMSYDEGEFAHLADSFSTMTTRLKESQERLAISQKIAAWQVIGRKIAHEVKNPLTPIAVCADDLRRSYQDNLPEFGVILDKNTAMIRAEVARLTRLLDEFVRFARMAPPEKQPTRLTFLCAEIAQLYQREIDHHRLKLESQCGEQPILLDSEQIKQVLINLIKNGLESAETARVVVNLTCPDRDLVISVLDNGPGFSDEKLKRGFEPYLSTKKDGSGLGLAICQRIIVDHGGTIGLFNRPEGGAGVTITLPKH